MAAVSRNTQGALCRHQEAASKTSPRFHERGATEIYFAGRCAPSTIWSCLPILAVGLHRCFPSQWSRATRHGRPRRERGDDDRERELRHHGDESPYPALYRYCQGGRSQHSPPHWAVGSSASAMAVILRTARCCVKPCVPSTERLEPAWRVRCIRPFRIGSPY
jgi:hypothetical protein